MERCPNILSGKTVSNVVLIVHTMTYVKWIAYKLFINTSQRAKKTSMWGFFIKVMKIKKTSSPNLTPREYKTNNNFNLPQ
jgi:hypothetical protein